jgi:two-component system cell cycle sensor histidine kinase/response regulator CckA
MAESRGRTLSLESKLPLMAGGVLFLVVAALTLASYVVVTDAERSNAALRLEQEAVRIAAAVIRGARGTLVAGRALASHPDVVAHLSFRDADMLAAVEGAMDYKGPRPELVLNVELIDAEGNRVLAVGREAARAPRLSVGELTAAASTGFGQIRPLGDVPVFPTVAPVRAGGNRLGWVVLWWHLDLNLTIENGQILIGNADGSFWTDLRAMVAPPGVDVATALPPMLYRRDGVVQLAASTPVAETPWVVLVERPDSVVLASTRRFLARLTGFALVLFAIACAGVWFLTRRITGPLRHLTVAATTISAGDYSIRVKQEGQDEIGLLANAFNHMAGRVQDSHRRVEEQASQYQMLFESNPSPMWVFDRESLRFLAVNRAALETYGYTLDEFLDMTIADIRPPGEVLRLREAFAQKGDRADYVGRAIHRTKAGEIIAVDITAHDVVFEGRLSTLVLARDVTERERAEQALQSAHETLRAIVGEAPVAIYSLDNEGIVRSWNPAAERIFGWTAAEAIGQPLPTVPKDIQGSVSTRRHEVESGQMLKGVELSRMTRDGGTVTVRVYAGPMHDAGGEVTGVMVVAADTTELRRLELQYRHAQKMEAVGRLAGGIAHDFNNLLTVILGESEMALDELGPADPTRPALEEITKAGNRAGQLTRQLLAFSRQQIIESHVFNLNELVADVERMLDRLIGEDVKLVTRLTLDPVPVRADRSQIEQLIINLAVNARDAMPDGGLLTIETQTLHLEDRDVSPEAPLRPGDYCVLSVNDSGSGMSEEVRSHIFEPFFTTKAPGRGTGLGLATCYGIVAQAGGHIEVASDVGVGTRFKIYLPRTLEQTPSTAAGSAVLASSGHERILLVEDQAAVRDVAARMLGSLGYEVLTAPDGETAMQILTGGTTNVDLLLTDVVLPGMNGGELARLARAVVPGLKVLFASGYTGDVAAYQALVDAKSALIQKPFTVSTLGERVRQALDHQG